MKRISLLAFLVALGLVTTLGFCFDLRAEKHNGPARWSAPGSNWSAWYEWTSPAPVPPAGYELDSFTYGLGGDRNACWAWSECKEAKVTPTGAISFKFRLQGHNERMGHYKSPDGMYEVVSNGAATSYPWVEFKYHPKK